MGYTGFAGFEDRESGVKLPQTRLVASGSFGWLRLNLTIRGHGSGHGLPRVFKTGLAQEYESPTAAIHLRGSQHFSPHGSILQEQASLAALESRTVAPSWAM